MVRLDFLVVLAGNLIEPSNYTRRMRGEAGEVLFQRLLSNTNAKSESQRDRSDVKSRSERGQDKSKSAM